MPEDLDVRWRRARSWLERVRVAAEGIEPLVREISALEDARSDMLPWRSRQHGAGSGHHGTHSDPTASEAERRMGELDVLIAERRSRLESLHSVVGECGDVLRDMGRALSERHARVIELYYIDCEQTWSDVAYELECDRSTVWRLRSDAYSWIERHHLGILV